MNFTYIDLANAKQEASFGGLTTVARGPVTLDHGWVGDSVNYSLERDTLIEFQSGPETTPGFTPSRAKEVSASYVVAAYGVSETDIRNIRNTVKRDA